MTRCIKDMAFALAAFLPLCGSRVVAEDIQGRVVGITDGDTLTAAHRAA
jgi:hypothetical protein